MQFHIEEREIFDRAQELNLAQNGKMTDAAVKDLMLTFYGVVACLAGAGHDDLFDNPVVRSNVRWVRNEVAAKRQEVLAAGKDTATPLN
ncbi:MULTISPECIES: hypothetical protein [unclassified Chelatococcus]|uniref:hypothetical protein n=1 Tax=unclassified Chelatococcus TaxID=2638111 RepID=UPI0002FA85D3|nr:MULTISPECIES: hypothetical protein [unclassified Chelatococcus]ALA16105.1 hypothetical protein AL346_00220 [Chelatococcus sp. CO-6]